MSLLTRGFDILPSSTIFKKFVYILYSEITYAYLKFMNDKILNASYCVFALKIMCMRSFR